MKEKKLIISALLLMLFCWAFPTYAQVTEGQSANQESSLSKFINSLNNMTDEQKAYARANWLVVPEFLTTCGSRLSELFIITIQCKQVFN